VYEWLDRLVSGDFEFKRPEGDRFETIRAILLQPRFFTGNIGHLGNSDGFVRAAKIGPILVTNAARCSPNMHPLTRKHVFTTEIDTDHLSPERSCERFRFKRRGQIITGSAAG
jgi:hypothetical protein